MFVKFVRFGFVVGTVFEVRGAVRAWRARSPLEFANPARPAPALANSHVDGGLEWDGVWPSLSGPRSCVT